MDNMPGRLSTQDTDGRDGEIVDVTITYLQMIERPQTPLPALTQKNVAILRAHEPPVHFYRYLYRLVGDPHHWVSRRRMNDEALADIIHNADVYILILYVAGVPAGFSEIDARNRTVSEIKFFGLAPDYNGRGLGKFFLAHIVDFAWSLGPERVRLETCTLDHPAALPLYQKIGFRVYDRMSGVVELMDRTPPAH